MKIFFVGLDKLYSLELANNILVEAIYITRMGVVGCRLKPSASTHYPDILGEYDTRIRSAGLTWLRIYASIGWC